MLLSVIFQFIAQPKKLVNFIRGFNCKILVDEMDTGNKLLYVASEKNICMHFCNMSISKGLHE